MIGYCSILKQRVSILVTGLIKEKNKLSTRATQLSISLGVLFEVIVSAKKILNLKNI